MADETVVVVEPVISVVEVTDTQVVVTTQDVLSTVEIGIAGPQGPPGGGSDANYVHTQGSAVTTWTVTHNLGKFPAVMIVTSAGDVVFGSIHYDSVNQLTLTFSAPFGGKVYLN